MEQQSSIDSANQKFWSELCGTPFAKQKGLTSRDKTTIEKFDQAYLDFYPYLLECIRPNEMRDKKVLEIGLGYGTLSRQIALAGAEFTGLDIAEGPVFMSNHSLPLMGLKGRAVQGSALSMPFPDATFDFVVSIGCLHHTGNMYQSLKEVARVLKPSGIAIVMVYNRYSLRQWMRWPTKTTGRWFRELIFGSGHDGLVASTREKIAYDKNSQGESAPETTFTSKREFVQILKDLGFKEVSVKKKNADFYGWRGLFMNREQALKWVGPVAGLDLYARAKK